MLRLGWLEWLGGADVWTSAKALTGICVPTGF